MKRGGPPQRKTPLKSGSSLRSSKPAALTGETQSKQRRSTGKHVGETKAKRQAKKRSGDTCEPRIPGVGCLYYGSDFHHRHLHGQGGLWTVENGLRVCRPCHSALTNTNGNRPEYERKGWIIPANQDPENRKRPEEIEVFMWHDERLDWWLLLPDGTADLAPFPKGDPRHPDDIEVRVDRGLGGVA